MSRRFSAIECAFHNSRTTRYSSGDTSRDRLPDLGVHLKLELRDSSERPAAGLWLRLLDAH